MKKEQMELKEVIKAAILEAFAEMYGVATLNDTDDSAPEDGEDGEDGEGDDKKGDGPKLDPIWGPAGFSLRKG